jgi:SAM-dependent methyltransferase
MTLEFTGERVTKDIMRPDHSSYDVYIEHLARYRFCLPLVSGKTVLDAACGVGYGTECMAQIAARVVGVDLDGDASSVARQATMRRNVDFARMDCRHTGFRARSFDVVVAFEFLEHIHEQAQFMEEITRILKGDGVLIISTPSREPYNLARKTPNPFHLCELSPEEFERLMRRYFGQVAIYGQRRNRSFLRYQDADRRLKELEIRVALIEDQVNLLMQSLPRVFFRGMIPDSLLRLLPGGIFSRLHQWYWSAPAKNAALVGQQPPDGSSSVTTQAPITVEDIEISSSVDSDPLYLIAVCRF